jgi:hypothetical protein
MAVMKIQTKQMIAFQMMMNKNTIGRQNQGHLSSHSRDKLESYIGDYNTMERVLRPRIVNRFKIFPKYQWRLKERKKRSFNNEGRKTDCHCCKYDAYRF